MVVGHKAVTSGDFKLDDLAGSAGRLDILLRCVNSTFFLSHGIRKDAEIYLVLQGEPRPPLTVRFSGAEVRYLNPDERSTGALVRNAILKADGDEIRSSPGVYVSRRSFAEVIAELASKSELVYLKEDGEDVRQCGSAAAHPARPAGRRHRRRVGQSSARLHPRAWVQNHRAGQWR